MKQTIGQAVKEKRELKKFSKEQLAKKLKLSVHYVNHIERNSPVRLSERVVGGLKETLGVKISKAEVNRHNANVAKIKSKYPSSKRS